MTCQDFLAALPKHKAELILTHNAHTSNYDTVESAVENDDHGYRKDDWISDEQRDLAVTNNECWTLQWYPNTPVGFNLASAYSLEALLEYVAREGPR